MYEYLNIPYLFFLKQEAFGDLELLSHKTYFTFLAVGIPTCPNSHQSASNGHLSYVASLYLTAVDYVLQ
jgi:hypothetical protein